MPNTQISEEKFLEMLHEKIASQGQNFLLDCAKILVEKEFSKIPNKSEMTTISFKIEVRKQNNSLRTKVDFDTF